MTKRHDHDHDHDHDPEREADPPGAVVPTPSAGALTSLAALSAALNAVDTTSVLGRSGMPMLQFKSRENNGSYQFGQRRTVPEPDSPWGVYLPSIMRGYVAFEGKKVIGERLAPISQPMPNLLELPDKGVPWTEEWTVGLKCLSGADAGVEVEFKSNTLGGNKAVALLIEAAKDRLNSGQHDGKLAPIVRLAKSSYQHSQYGRVWEPVFEIVDWMPLDGPAPAPAPTPPSSPPSQPAAAAADEQPRRRRRVA